MILNFFCKTKKSDLLARVAQLEEQRPSKAKVTGSSPVSRTILKIYIKVFDLFRKLIKLNVEINKLFGLLAQLVRAPALQAGGRRFNSYITHHLLELYNIKALK